MSNVAFVLTVFTSLQCYLKRAPCVFRQVEAINHTFPRPCSVKISKMLYQDKAPYAAQDPKEISSLLTALDGSITRGRKNHRSRFSCRKSDYRIAGTDGLVVSSWKFNDWDYKRDDLPTYARGLFTYERKDGSSEIASRGYDKFFNVDEVNDTKWQNVETFTKGPYELSVKENGCIIFISGLEGDKLLVCSKHSTGAGQEAAKSHAVVGETWVDKHLAAAGRTREDLARELRRRNVTAVAELCDDEFEEHVLAYDKATAGLYLHGMNLNLPDFATYSGSMVHKFADEWGFKKAQYLVKDDIASMKTFLEKCAETGSWAGRDTEGFVVRCQKRSGGTTGEFQDWFFKYKFEEPYLMYRQWREATKAVIAGRVPRYKKHQKITEEYLLFARKQLAHNPGLGKAYNQNHGIIKMRNDFLQERGVKGSDILRDELAEGGLAAKDVTNHVVLVTVASIGCGKTTLALALTKLFGWGHVQNDNITGAKGRPQKFATQLCNNLAKHTAVIADRNNHQRRERQQIFNDVTKVISEARYVALQYVHDPKPKLLPEIRRVTRARVLERGDNHQTIHAGTKSQEEIIGIMEGFLQRFEPVDPSDDPDNSFDEIINLDATAETRQNLDMAVDALHKAFPKLVPEVPSPDQLDDALTAATTTYAPLVKHDLSFQSKNKQRGNDNSKKGPNSKVEYFCVRVYNEPFLSALATTFDGQDATTAAFYRQLQGSRRIQTRFHVTLIHRNLANEHQALWSRLTDLQSKAQSQNRGVADPLLGTCRVRLERVVWDARVMYVVARLLDPGWETANRTAHITVGTADESIKPKESNDLIAKWSREGANAGNGIWELDVRGGTELNGDVKAVTPMTR